MNDLGDLATARHRDVYRLSFKRSVELEYREAARGMRRYTRTLLFALLGLCFVFGSLYERSFYGVTATIEPLLRIIELAIVAPAALAAAVATFSGCRRDITSALQTVAVVCIWSSVLLLRRLALEGQMYYPTSMICITVLAVAIFAGFNWYRIALGASAILLLAGYQEYTVGKDTSQAWLETNTFVWIWLIAVLGSYVNETRFRLAWINGRSAALLAKTDILTGLSNRLEFNHVFPRIIRQANREKSTIAVALIDIDHFKRINDTYGHHYGDEVLKAVGRTLLDGPPRRPFDLKVRYGGEELVVIWYAVSSSVLPRLIEETLSAIRLIRVDGPGDAAAISVTASMGVTYLRPDDTAMPQAILAFADRLMYRAKAEGRDRAVLEPYIQRAV